MSRFRKKPIVIDAIRAEEVIHNAWHDWESLPDWINHAYRGKTEGVRTLVICPDHVSISTREGVMRAEKNDWIIRGVRGELYPCKPEIFEATYEAVESTPSSQL